jgi:putative hydrolase of the HAD superfamily
VSVRCVTFDLDDTLWAVEPVIVRAEQKFYEWVAERLPRVADHYHLNALTAHRRKHYLANPAMRHDLTLMRKAWLRDLVRYFGYDEALVEEGFRVFWEWRNAVTLFDQALALLEGLRGRYRLGAITNGNADVHHIGIGHYFDFVVTAAQAGAAKPHASVFEAALCAADAPAHRAVHVGDDPATDVLGASAVGMRAVWYNPELAPWPGGQVPDAVITRLDALPGVLAEFEAV